MHGSEDYALLRRVISQSLAVRGVPGLPFTTRVLERFVGDDPDEAHVCAASELRDRLEEVDCVLQLLRRVLCSAGLLLPELNAFIDDSHVLLPQLFCFSV